MATAQESGSGGLASAVGSARDFVRERLREADTAMSPSELADEYDCSSAHMSNICSELNQSGEIERIETGRYVDGEGPGEGFDGPAPEQSESESEEPTERESEPEGEQPEGSAEGESDSESVPSADGGPRSEDRDTEGEDGPSDRDTALAAAGTAGAAAVPVALEEFGTREWAMIGAGALVVYFVFIRDSGGDGEDESSTDQGDGTVGQQRASGGGLVEERSEDDQEEDGSVFEGDPWGGA